MRTAAHQPPHRRGPPAWPAPRLRALQVEELFRFAGTSAAFSFLGALLTLGVLFEAGTPRSASALWFLAATSIAVTRALIVFFYRRREPDADPQRFADAYTVANFAAGVLFGALGTVLFPSGPVYAQLFVVMVIICFVAGSVTAYAPVRFAHDAMSIPATVPTALYLFFVRDGCIGTRASRRFFSASRSSITRTSCTATSSAASWRGSSATT